MIISILKKQNKTKQKTIKQMYKLHILQKTLNI